MSTNSYPESVLSVNTLCLYINVLSFRVCERLLHMRSKFTIHVLDTYKDAMSSLLVLQNNTKELDKILEYCDDQSLPDYCFPDSYQFLEAKKSLEYLLCVSLSSSPYFSLNVNEPYGICSCKMLGIKCLHFESTINKSYWSSYTFNVPYVSIKAFIQFGIDCLEEYFNKIYLKYLNKLIYH